MKLFLSLFPKFFYWSVLSILSQIVFGFLLIKKFSFKIEFIHQKTTNSQSSIPFIQKYFFHHLSKILFFRVHHPWAHKLASKKSSLDESLMEGFSKWPLEDFSSSMTWDAGKRQLLINISLTSKTIWLQATISSFFV